MRHLLATCVVGLLSLVASPTFAQEGHHFHLMNQTGVTIDQLYVSVSGRPDWGQDILGRDVLPDGESTTINFTGPDACFWDIRITDTSGTSLAWGGNNLCKYGTVILHCAANKGCWATYTE